MALIIQTPQTSLIGGGSLPRAQATGSTPDIAGPLNQLGNELMNRGSAQDQQKQNQDDALKGATAGASFVGLDANGKPVPFKLPDGSPAYRAAYLDAANSKLDSEFEQGLTQQFNDIQNRSDITPEVKDQLMREALKGSLNSAFPHRKADYLAWGTGQITQRSTLMAAQAAREQEQLSVNSLTDQIKRDTDQAASAAAAGLAPDEYYKRIAKNYDTLVGLKRIAPEQAAAAKNDVKQIVTAGGLNRRLVDELFKGNVDPVSLAEFATKVDQGGDATLSVTTADEFGRAGRGTQDYKASDVQKTITDPTMRSNLAQNLRQAATLQNQIINSGARKADMRAVISNLNGRKIDSWYQDDMNKMMAQALNQPDALNNADSLGQIIAMTAQTRYLARPLAERMISMVNAADPATVQRGAQLFHLFRTLKDGKGDLVGPDLMRDIPDNMQNVLAAAETAVYLGFSPDQVQKNIRAINGNMTKTSISDNISAYDQMVNPSHQPGVLGFSAQARAQWTSTFAQPMPPEAQDFFVQAYNTNMLVHGDPQASFNDAFARVSGRYKYDPIFVNGLARAGDVPIDTNPPGFVPTKRSVMGDVAHLFDPNVGNAMPAGGYKHEWLSNFLENEIRNAKIVGMSPDQVNAMIKDPEASVFDLYHHGYLGSSVFLSPTETSLAVPEYQVYSVDQAGQRKPVMVQDANGNVQPMIVRPGTAWLQQSSKFQISDEKKGIENTYDQLVRQAQRKAYDAVPATPSQQMDRSKMSFDEWMNSPEVPDAVDQAYQQSLDTIRQGYNKQLDELSKKYGTEVPKEDIGPQTLLQPQASGLEVAKQAVAAIDKIVPDGTGGTFMLRVAAQESRFGTVPGSFRASGDKGMWQVNTGSGFRLVMKAVRSGSGPVAVAADRIKQATGLDLSTIEASDLDKPLVGAAVARLYFIAATNREIPTDVAGQARLWKDVYNTYLGAGTAAQFVHSASRVPDGSI